MTTEWEKTWRVSWKKTGVCFLFLFSVSVFCFFLSRLQDKYTSLVGGVAQHVNDLIGDGIGGLASDVDPRESLHRRVRIDHPTAHSKRDAGSELLCILVVPREYGFHLPLGELSKGLVGCEGGDDRVRARVVALFDQILAQRQLLGSRGWRSRGRSRGSGGSGGRGGRGGVIGLERLLRVGRADQVCSPPLHPHADGSRIHGFLARETRPAESARNLYTYTERLFILAFSNPYLISPLPPHPSRNQGGWPWRPRSLLLRRRRSRRGSRPSSWTCANRASRIREGHVRSAPDGRSARLPSHPRASVRCPMRRVDACGEVLALRVVCALCVQVAPPSDGQPPHTATGST